ILRDQSSGGLTFFVLEYVVQATRLCFVLVVSETRRDDPVWRGQRQWEGEAGRVERCRRRPLSGAPYADSLVGELPAGPRTREFLRRFELALRLLGSVAIVPLAPLVRDGLAADAMRQHINARLPLGLRHLPARCAHPTHLPAVRGKRVEVDRGERRDMGRLTDKEVLQARDRSDPDLGRNSPEPGRFADVARVRVSTPNDRPTIVILPIDGPRRT